MDHLPDYKAERRDYLTGFVLALVLTLLPFLAVALPSVSRQTAIYVIAICALLQVVVQLRFFLHIDLSRQKREDLHLILFATLLVLLMVAGTIWIMANLATRMTG
ncbi:cytochrome o ubiquinol oxidase subunit IV [uncultured Maricaulis sp.]|uniref:cytochrome o ubiquinol oxidase subunit IV n=1 Tax=uncultured Maricaulis sp. TaxID=174710 RepID=UPI0030DBD017|tara:strand:- start:101769 stop:102083 length:315 start_codon:yes stop_codon:yes gene_type:complete